MVMNATDMTLKGALVEVLEQFAYMLVDEDSNGCSLNGCPRYHHAMMTFVGPGQGVVMVTVPQSLSKEMAANVLGLDADEVTDEAAEDVLKEFLNVLCGKVTNTLYGDKAVINLTVPVLYRIDHGKWLEMSAESDTVGVTVEGRPLLATLEVLHN